MVKMCVALVSVLLVASGCSVESQEEPKEKALVLVNAGGVESEVLEHVREFAQRQLYVPVRSAENQSLAGLADFQTLEEKALKVKSEADVTFIVLTALDQESEPLKVFEESGVAIVNVTPLKTDDAKVFDLRVERMVMRAAAFSFGLSPTPDPFCVTRDYRSMADLDRMGRNFSPPWQAKYAKEAAARGLIAPKAEVPDVKKAP